MRVLISAGWLGGAGGAERALHSVIRALAADEVDVVVRQHLDGPFAVVGDNVRVYPLMDWRWRASARNTGLKGRLIQRGLNPLRRAILPEYDVYLQFFSGGNIAPTVNAKVRLLIPSGLTVPSAMASNYDYVALQAPDNVKLAPPDAKTVLLPPPLFHLSEDVSRPKVDLPEEYYLTVFNPYDPVKGVDDLAHAVRSAPHPIVWCHSQRTLQWPIPEELVDHPGIVHVDDPSPAEMRYLYERCLAYLSFSRSEGFGWSTADALRYSRTVVSRRIGVLSYPEVARLQGVYIVGDNWEADWAGLLHASGFSGRELDLVSPHQFRTSVARLANSITGPQSTDDKAPTRID